MDGNVIAELAPTGTLRAGINTANFLLVKGQSASGDWEGVAPDVARAIGARLGVPVSFVPFAKASLVGDAVSHDACDIALIGKDPAREQNIAFTAPYAAIEATYLVWGEGPIASIADVDQSGVRISVGGGSAYDLWLIRNIAHAELVRASSVADSKRQFVDQGLEALAGLRPGLLIERDRLPGTRILDGCFTTVNQAVGIPRGHLAALAFLTAFVEEIKASGLVGRMIEQNGVRGLSVAELAR
jgi:polar amino acid transport system substrate-binding protein